MMNKPNSSKATKGGKAGPKVRKKYNHKTIEAKWQEYWATKKTFVASDTSKKPKKFILVEFPYPSGYGLHMGHLRPYTAGDVYSKFMRLKGFETVFPMGWDAFGLPAENFAIKHGVHPEVSTKKNVANAKKQLQSWGMSFDWSREVNTTDPDYYKWTQWIFLQLYKAGLAYEATGLINWCPKDKTGLANEEVQGGVCERCGSAVEKKELRQWYLRITNYAEKLLAGLRHLPEWPEPVKLQQENWIGKSLGAEIDFHIAETHEKLKVFTTRPDTLFGVTFMVVAPEHPVIKSLSSRIHNIKEVNEYIDTALQRTEIERGADDKEKTGVRLEGIHAILPGDEAREIPIFVADYVLFGYGTGAIMAVPANDERDGAFAKKYHLPVIQVIDDNGKLINSREFNGEDFEAAKKSITARFGKGKIQYKLRDWVFSRQRYWGEPIPIIHCEQCGVVPVPEKDLPVVLPKVKKYLPTGTGESPLAGIESWVNTKCPKCKKSAKRETNTMPQWAGSSWYWLRYTDPKNKKIFADKKRLQRWTPVDIYFGGMEHTTLHLLYSRFWNQVLHDQKLVPASEPYDKRVPHGIVLGPDGDKMSKSKGNVVDPAVISKQWGSDTMRMYMLFLGPHGSQVAWNDQGIIGVRRFLERVWVWVNQNNVKRPASSVKVAHDVEKALHKLVDKVGKDIESFSFNTTISAMMQFISEVKELPASKEQLRRFLIVLFPFASHIAEELNHIIGGKKSLQNEQWPEVNKRLLKEDLVDFIVQINGKVREKIQLPPDATQEQAESIVLNLQKIKDTLEGRQMVRKIFVPGRLLNLVVKL
ncbi:MAG TPA: leucine--tRNA ligase [Patescibacteria group bacterium]|nr:leucine--tRNA ligase [Patescibacteria group bacterium]